MENNIILTIQKEFASEANNAPTLFKDLAKVEHYIAESYKTRSFIELVQNADDANSKVFGIHIFDNFVIIGNNGRDFNEDDVKAICRSGSSNKVRGLTIGYRGIGFKSVVNLAEKVYIVSGNMMLMFDKNLTKQLLNINDDVPLIRIPHVINQINHIDEVNNIKQEFGYSTIFLFENIKENIIENEFKSFDKSSILFLNSVERINLISKNDNRIIIKKMNENLCEISENQINEKWMIISSSNKYDKLAFKIENGEIISANKEESLIHSFTPTTELPGGYFKMNGNFSTDPSRKNIDFDEESEKSFNNCTSMITTIIGEILNGNDKFIGFFKPFVEFNNGINSNKIRVKLLNGIKENMYKFNNFNNIRLKPDMILMQDYKEMCKNRYVCIDVNVLTNYPEINKFLELVEIPYLSLEEMIDCINQNSNVSSMCLATIFCKIIKKYRYDFTEDVIKKISQINIFVKNGERVNAQTLKNYSNLDEDYSRILTDNCEIEDIKFSFKKLGIEYDILNQKKINRGIINIYEDETYGKSINYINTNDNRGTSIKNPLLKGFKEQKYPNIQKWRGAEINLAEYIKCFESVNDVKDVSVSNLGYDLEVKLIDGSIIYVEVKSVVSFFQAFKITNNEYTCAHNYGDDYYIALVINDDDFKVKFIRNPIENLHFEKKCEQWSWYCEQYNANLIDIDKII